LSDIKFMGSRFAKPGHAFVAGSLMLGLAACGGAATDDSAETVGEVESNLTQSQAQPFEGECTSTQTLDKVTLSTGDVIRATCSIVCKKAAYSMGVWSNYIIRPDGSATPSASNYGTGVSGVARSTTVDVPYVPGGYQVSCKPFYQEKSSSYKTFVNWQYTAPTVF
jgi:hypothetical protein